MSVANIFNIPQTEEQWAAWSLLHMIWHRSCNVAIFRRFNIILPEFILDPIDPEQPDVFLANHQTMHTNIDLVLGVPSFDLLDVDWSDEAQRLGWFAAHAQLTQQESLELGIAA